MGYSASNRGSLSNQRTAAAGFRHLPARDRRNASHQQARNASRLTSESLSNPAATAAWYTSAVCFGSDIRSALIVIHREPSRAAAGIAGAAALRGIAATADRSALDCATGPAGAFRLGSLGRMAAIATGAALSVSSTTRPAGAAVSLRSVCCWQLGGFSGVEAARPAEASRSSSGAAAVGVVLMSVSERHDA